MSLFLTFSAGSTDNILRMDTKALLERKKREILRALKGGSEPGVGSIVRSELVGEIRKARKNQQAAESEIGGSDSSDLVDQQAS